MYLHCLLFILLTLHKQARFVYIPTLDHSCQQGQIFYGHPNLFSNRREGLEGIRFRP